MDPCILLNQKKVPETIPQQLAGAPFVVDYWGAATSIFMYFLSHMHADHTQGLRDNWHHGPIYCSSVSRKLLLHKFKINPTLVHALPIGETQTLFLNAEKTELLNVTLIDANHCPGAVMFLFESKKYGCILHTGDFRYCSSMLDEESVLYQKNIDRLFLDTTFLGPKHNFPARNIAEIKLMKLIEKWLPTHHIVIGTDSLGKEDLLANISKRFNIPIGVDPDRFETIKIANDEMTACYFTSPKEKARISVYPKRCVHARLLFELNLIQPTIGILPTAFLPRSFRRHSLLFHVPYSLHSSNEELIEFVKRLGPHEVFSSGVTAKLHGDVRVLRLLVNHERLSPFHSSIHREKMRMKREMKMEPTGLITFSTCNAMSISLKEDTKDPSSLLIDRVRASASKKKKSNVGVSSATPPGIYHDCVSSQAWPVKKSSSCLIENQAPRADRNLPVSLHSSTKITISNQDLLQVEKEEQPGDLLSLKPSLLTLLERKEAKRNEFSSCSDSGYSFPSILRELEEGVVFSEQDVQEKKGQSGDSIQREFPLERGKRKRKKRSSSRNSIKLLRQELNGSRTALCASPSTLLDASTMLSHLISSRKKSKK